MRWEKAIDQGPLVPSPVEAWGNFTIYIEIGDDGYAVREVREFESGKFLRYDRVHWIDDLGMLAGAQLGKKKTRKSQWTVIAIEAAEFENVWRKASESAEWKSQVETSQVKKLGSHPPWIIPRRSS